MHKSSGPQALTLLCCHLRGKISTYKFGWGTLIQPIHYRETEGRGSAGLTGRVAGDRGCLRWLCD